MAAQHHPSKPVNLRQQIVLARVADAASRIGLTDDLAAAFERYAHALVLGSSVMALDKEDITGGGQEKQIDAFTIQESPHEATVYLTQTKIGDGFSSNDLILLHNGVDWCFGKTDEELKTLQNENLRQRIEDLFAVLKRVGPARLKVVVSYVTTGDSKLLSPEFVQERKSLLRFLQELGLAGYSVQVWGAAELVSRADEIDREPPKIDADLPIYTDRIHSPSIEFHGSGTKGVVCTVDAVELAGLVNRDANGFVFDWNIRQFLGTKGAVNTAILETCSRIGRAELFWFLNNGITIVADHVDVVAIKDSPLLKLRNLQIVNGCQTASVLAAALRDDILSPSTRVLVRAYQALDSEMISSIVESTNTQNKITTRNLKANDRQQIEMGQAFAAKGFYFERKPRQFGNNPKVTPGNLMPNEEVGQS